MQIDVLRDTNDYRRLITRAGMVIEGLGVVGAFLGDGLPDAVQRYGSAAAEFGG